MFIIELLVVLLCIYLGSRLGGIGLGFAGGFGILILTLIFKLPAGHIPNDVILIIACVITTIAAVQVAGGLDYMVDLAEILIRKNPARIVYLAPAVTYFLTVFTGTGFTTISMLPVIAEVAKEEGIRPSRPLSIAVVASQVAITASPLSAAVIYLSSLLFTLNITFYEILMITIPATFTASMIGAFVSNFIGKPLKEDKIYQQHLADGHVSVGHKSFRSIKPKAKRSVYIFFTAIVAIISYAILANPKLAIIHPDVLSLSQAVIAIMLTCSLVITLGCNISTEDIVDATTFKSGMSACICIIGIAWLGDTYINAHLNEIKNTASSILQQYPVLLAVILFFSATLLYSQAVTTKALMPAAMILGVSPLNIIAAFPAVSALFILPTYPTLLAAIQMDQTGSTRIGKYVINHPFIIPGIVTIVFSVGFAYMIGAVIL